MIIFILLLFLFFFRVNPVPWKKKLPKNINMLSNNRPQKAWISRWFPFPCTQQGIVFRRSVCVCVCSSGWRGACVSTSHIPNPQHQRWALWSVGKPKRAAEHLARVSRRPDLGTPWNPWHLSLASWLNGCHILWWTEAGESEAARDEYGLIFT